MSRVNGSDFIVHDKIVFLEFLQRLCDIYTSRDVKQKSERVNIVSACTQHRRRYSNRPQAGKLKKNLFESFFHALCHHIFKALYISFRKTLHDGFKSPAGAAEELIMLVVSFAELLQCVGVTHTHTHYRYVDFTVHGQLLELKTDMCYIFSYLGITVDDLGYYGSWSTPGVSVCVCVHCRSSAKATTSNA